MRAKGINTMSTRRAVRPDSQVYRETRRIGRRRTAGSPRAALLAAAILLVFVLIVVWWVVFRRHG